MSDSPYPAYVAQALGVDTAERVSQVGGPRLGFRVEVVDDPQSEADTMEIAFEESLRGRRPRNKYLERLARQASPVTVVEGGLRYNGRACCYAFLADVEQRIHLVKLPWTDTCPGCQTQYRISLAVG